MLLFINQYKIYVRDSVWSFGFCVAFISEQTVLAQVWTKHSIVTPPSLESYVDEFYQIVKILH